MTPRNATAPLRLTDRTLDAAIAAGWRNLSEQVNTREPKDLARWISVRSQGALLPSDIADVLHQMKNAANVEERASSAAELAETVDDLDPELATACWDGVLQSGYAVDDGEVIFEGVRNLAHIEEEYGDVLTAAEYHVDFLNWRRQPGSVSDSESVMTSLEEVARLASLDGEQVQSALYEHYLAEYLLMAEKTPEQAECGDWRPSSPPFAAWE